MDDLIRFGLVLSTCYQGWI